MNRLGELRGFTAYIVFIFVAEIVTSFVDPGYGLVLHAIILMSLLVLSSLKYGENTGKLYLTMSLAPLIRIISLSIPLTYFPSYAWFLVVNVPVLVAAVAMMRVQGISFMDAGFVFSKPLEVAVIALTGIPIGFIDHFFLRPEPMGIGLSFWNLVLLALGLGFSTGFVEELVFRGLMQKNAVDAFGERIGVIGVAAVFAALHIGWFSLPDLVFVFSVGLFYGFMVLKTGNIVGVSLSHGITNIVLFLIAPAISLI